MIDQHKSEPFVSMNVLLLFLLPTLGMIILIGNAIAQIGVEAGWLLPFALLCLVAPIIYIAVGERPSPAADRRRFFVALITCLLLVIGLTVRQIAIRPPANVPEGMYDGAVQSEVAAQYLLRGINPYGADYRGTPYAAVNKPIPGGPTQNVVWFHYIYPPLTFLLFVPIELMRPLLGELTDYRLLTIGALMLITFILVSQAPTYSQRTTVTVLTLGNPLLWGYAVVGANDLLGPAAIIGATLLIQKKQWLLAGIIFGLAVAAKQTTWIITPLWLYWVWRQSKDSNQPRNSFKRQLLGLSATVAVTFGPFLLWHPSRILTDVWSFASGAIPHTYPISGTTFLQYLHVLRLVPSAWSVIPTYLYQLSVGAPLLALTLYWIRRSAEPSRWLGGAAILSLGVLLFSRYFNNNYLGFPITLLVGALVLSWPSKKVLVDDHE